MVFFRKRDLNCSKIANRAKFFFESVTNGVIALRKSNNCHFFGFFCEKIGLIFKK